MRYASVFVPFVDVDTAPPAFSAAAAVASAFSAHVIATHIRQRPLPVGVVYFPLGGAYPAADVDLFERSENERASKLRELFDSLCADLKTPVCRIADHPRGAGATASWRDVEGQFPEALAAAAASFDLSVVARGADTADAGIQSIMAEEILFRSGRPCLIVSGTGLDKPPARVLIGWNGSPEAARAVASAMPFLVSAEAVRIVTIREAGQCKPDPADLAAALELHGVSPGETEIELEPGQGALNIFEGELSEFRPDLAVLGAYGHSRLREAVFGGVTRRAITRWTLPVLLAR